MVFKAVETAKEHIADLTVGEWNLAEHPELGPRYGVMATPAIVINGRLEFRGVPKEADLLARLQEARNDSAAEGMTDTPTGTARGRAGAEMSELAGRPGSRFNFAVLGAAGGLVLLGLIGYLAWNKGALIGLRWVEFDSPVTLAAFGFVTGVGAFFAPCAFALFPGYISCYVASTGTGSEGAGRSLMLGLSCAGGSTVFFALTGAAITLVGGPISPYLIATKPIIAVAVVLLGIVLLADIRLPSFGVPIGGLGPRLPPAAALFLYGFGYALASTGCTLPIYVSIIVLPLTSGFAGAALLTFASFAVAMALMMLLTSVLVGLAKASLLRRLQASTVWIKRASGAMLIVAGLYLGYYYVAAGM